MRHPLFDERGKAANEVDADRLRRVVKRLRDGYEGVRLTRVRRNRNRRDRDALVDDGDAVLRLDVLARTHKVLRRARDFLVDILAELVDVRMCTVPQGDSHRDRAHIETVLRNHPICFADVLKCSHSAAPRSHAVHDLKDILMLDFNLETALLALLPQKLLQIF